MSVRWVMGIIAIGTGILVCLPSYAEDKVTAEKSATRYWEYTETDGSERIGRFAGTDGGEWLNVTGGGDKHKFAFVRRTTRFTELFDKARAMTVLIYEDGYTEWSVGAKWNRGGDGRWVK